MKQSKSRKSREATAFLYERLSRDDNLDGDSYSIQNQKKICQGEIFRLATWIFFHCRGKFGYPFSL